jgi:hypothetical protein
MKPDAIYYFNRIPEYRTRYKQIRYKGKRIPDFPSIYKKGKYKGEKYIVFRETSDYYNQGKIQFSHALELANSQIITGLYFMPEYPRQSYGKYKNYGVIIEFSEDFEQLAIWFFEGLEASSPSLFQKKQAGQIPEVTKADTLKLRYMISYQTRNQTRNKLLYPPISDNMRRNYNVR